MKLSCLINGQPAELEIAPDDLLRGALPRREAAKYLSIGLTKLNALRERGDVVVTSYGTYPLVSLNAHLEAETRRGKK